MQRLLRIAFMWLIVLAIPAQGIAAASMSLCGPGHGDMSSPSPASHHHHDAVHDHEDAIGASTHVHHPHAAGQADPLGGMSILGGQPLPDVEKASDLTCSVCAACCSSAALPSDAVPFQPPSLPTAFIAARTVGEERFLPGGLERPPRALLA